VVPESVPSRIKLGYCVEDEVNVSSLAVIVCPELTVRLPVASTNISSTVLVPSVRVPLI